jgi:hypothetical protein
VSRPPGSVCVALAALVYLAVPLFLLRAVLPSPATRLPYPVLLHESQQNLVDLDHADQSMVVATIAGNAHRLLESPASALGGGQCFPMPRSYTLGEHMLTMGLLAAPAYALSGDPILSYNIAFLLSFWIASLAMYAFAFFLTRSHAAAFVAGLAFALLPGRIVDSAHPYVLGDRWTPLALLFLHRATRGGGFRNALGLALAMSLQVGESLYPLLGMGFYLSVYGLFLVARDPRGVLRAVPYLTGVAIVVGLVTWLVLGPYLEARSVWGTLSGRYSYPMTASKFTPGHEYFPGFAVTTLAFVALFDRAFARSDAWAGRDMRIALATAGVLVAWCGLERVTLPFTGIVLRSPLLLAKGLVPGLDAARGLQAVALSTGVATSSLAAYGICILAERLGRRRVLLVAACASLVVFGTRVYGPLARASFGRTLRLTSWEARPAAADLALVRGARRGAVLDVPVPFVEGDVSFKSANMLLRASYGPRDSAACYNSFGSPVLKQVWLLASALPSPSSVAALAALGFETLLWHHDGSNGDVRLRARLEAAPATLGAPERSGDLERRALAPPGPISTDWADLENGADAPMGETLRVIGPRARLSCLLRNGGTATFRHPDPLEPSDLVAQWRALDSKPGADREWTEPLRALLPIALGPGAALPVDVAVALPERPGRYRLTLARAAAPDRPLAAREIEVVNASANAPAPAAPSSSLELLGPDEAAPPVRLPTDASLLSFAVRNRGPGAYGDLGPRSLRRLRLEWIDARGEVVDAERLGVYVPPSIPVGATVSIEVPIVPPPPGRYVARLVPATGSSEHVIGSRAVEVTAATPVSSS